MIIVTPDFNKDSGEKLAHILNMGLMLVYTRKFPNGEVLARLEDVSYIKNESIILYFPTYPDTNNRILLLLETLETLNSYNANNISLILPYLSYSRQDKRFLEGESLSLKLFLDILSFLNVNKLVSVDVHNEDAVKRYAKMDIDILSLYEPLIRKIVNDIVGDKEFILVAPDAGRTSVVAELANIFSCRYIYFKKKRDRYTGNIKMEVVGDLPTYKYAIIVDDEVSTGGTMAMAANYLKKAGVKNVIAAAIHLLLVNHAEERLFSSGVDYIVGTNTIVNPFSIIDIEDFLPTII